MDLIWTNNGVPSPCHFMCAVYFAFGFVAARFFLDRFIFRRLAIWLLCYGAIPLKFNEATRAEIVKWTESMWKSTYYATVELCVLRITYNEPCFKYTKGYFRGWPNQELKLPLKLFYMCPCGFYTYSIAALLTWETRRILHVPLVAHTAQDFSVVMSHHVVTVILIGYSYITSFFQIGSIVLALHDASDVFLEAAKVFKYSEKELGASLCFGFFDISWLLLKLIFFPFWIIISSSYDIREFLRLSEAYPMSLYCVFNTMLLTLLVFHVYYMLNDHETAEK
ncbi:hypothetical protein ACSBR2_019279 [Camellia fascicularis]